MSTTKNLTTALDAISGTGKFTSCGDTPFFLPDICVHDEELAFPLPPSQIKYLISLAEQAPYGKGHETVLDESVRQSWQIDAKHIQFPKKGPWLKYLKKIRTSIAEDMGIHQPFILDPYKLLIYEKGGHFLPHTDTEKIPHMFATLVIALPSKHNGGELLVRHAGEEVKVQFDSTTKDFQHAAFFSDCEHEVKPVTSGYRVCLTYNIAFKKKPTAKLNQGFLSFVPQLTTVLTELKPELDKSQNPLRAILLNHQYTKEHFSLAALKNEDFTKAKALMAAAEKAGYDSHLGLITLYQMGELDNYYEDDYGHDVDYDSGSMGEIYDEELSIDNWRNKNDKSVDLGTYNIAPDIFIPKTDLTASEPDEEEFEGYTGNAGCTMEYWYRKAAVVLWQKNKLNTILCRYSLKGATQTFLNYKSNGLNKKSAESLGQEILKTLKKYQQDSARLSLLPISETAEGICELKSEAMLNDLFSTFSSDLLCAIDEPTWKNLFSTFDHSLFIPYFKNLPKEVVSYNSKAILPPLHAILKKSKTSPLIPILANAITQHKFSQSHTYSRTEPSTIIDHHILHLILAASSYIPNKKSILPHIQHNMSLDHIRTKLGPALLEKKHKKHFSASLSLQLATLNQVIKILEKEIARPIAPYPNWSRPYQEESHPHHTEDKYFAQLKLFYLDPDLKTTDIGARADIRQSLENHIRDAQLDLNTKIIRLGSPHKLRLTKNSNSYRRTLEARRNDKTLLKKLTQ